MDFHDEDRDHRPDGDDIELSIELSSTQPPPRGGPPRERRRTERYRPPLLKRKARSPLPLATQTDDFLIHHTRR